MIKYTMNWYNGEIFEAYFILGFGIITIISSLFFYYLGNTPTSKALLIPMLVVGVFFTATGISMAYSNGKKLTKVEEVYIQNKHQFVKDEIKRVEDFQYLYPLSIGISSICFAIALGLLYFSKNVHLQAIAIALIIFGAGFAFIDYFSKERATIYYEQLQNM